MGEEHTDTGAPDEAALSDGDDTLTPSAEGSDERRLPGGAEAGGAPVESGGLLGYLKHRPDPLTSLVLTIPVFLIYHLGILAIDLRNGVDLISNLAFSLLERSQLAYMGVTVGFCVGIAIALWGMRRSGRLRPVALLPIILESTLLAVVMTISVGWATQKIVAGQLGDDPTALGPIEKLVMAAGAGFHEELVFRAFLFAGMSWALVKLAKWSQLKAGLVAALVSSLLFSAVHYVGELGDAFTVASFTFRFLAGLYFAALYRLRGFAVAVYTHAIYDVMVFFVFS